jgi:hypothetical protein
MNRLFVLTGLALFLGYMLHKRKRRCTSKEWMNKSIRHHVLPLTGFHGQFNSQNRPSVTFATPFPCD